LFITQLGRRAKLRTQTGFKKWFLVALTMVLLVTALGISAVPIAATDPQLPLKLVTDTLTVYGSTTSAMQIVLDAAGTKEGWCININTDIVFEKPYEATLYDYFGRYQDGLSDTLPQDIINLNWHAIAFILNNKVGTPDDIQAAIWYFTNNVDPGVTQTDAWSMINEANKTENKNFVPSTGDIRPIICFISDNPYFPEHHGISEDVQPIFFEYSGHIPSFPLPELPAVALFGLGLVGIGCFIFINKHARVV
jgi:hypothetical protein